MKGKVQANERDPLGLSNLPLLEPGQNDWPLIQNAISSAPSASRTPRRVAWASAASIAIVAMLVFTINNLKPGQGAPGPSSAHTPVPTQVESADLQAQTPGGEVATLIALSQKLETRLLGLRRQTAYLPAQSALFVAELEDTITQLDSALSDDPRAVDLWGQRVNLLLDLEAIYQRQWEREYGRMASL